MGFGFGTGEDSRALKLEEDLRSTIGVTEGRTAWESNAEQIAAGGQCLDIDT